MKVPAWLTVSWFPSWNFPLGPKKKAENSKRIIRSPAFLGPSKALQLATARLHPFQKAKWVASDCIFCNWGGSAGIILTPLGNIYHPLQLELESQPSCQSSLWLLVSYSFKQYLRIFQALWWMIFRCSGKTFRVLGTKKLAVISIGSYCGSFSCLLWPKRPTATAECLILLILSLQELGFCWA